MARKCRFCGGGPLTKEHGWPLWLDKFLPKREVNQTVIPDDFIPQDRGKRNTVSGAEVRYVCRNCNNGWMSEIETAAIPFVGPMAQGRGTVLNKEAQAAVATWIVKTSFVQQFANPGELGEQFELQVQEFRKIRSPLQSHYVSTAAFTGDEWVTVSHYQPLIFVERDESSNAITNTIDGYVVTILVGHFFGQVFHTPSPTHSTNDTGSFGVIWPYESDLIWPPGRFLNPEMLKQAAKTNLTNFDRVSPDSEPK